MSLRPYVRESESSCTMSRAHINTSQLRFGSCHVSAPRLVLVFTPLAVTTLYPSRGTSRYLHGASRMQGKVQCQFSFTGTFTEASRSFTDACFLKQRGKTRGKSRENNFLDSTCFALQGVLRRRSYIHMCIPEGTSIEPKA